MHLPFRQGLARYQTDVLSTPTFLQKGTGGSGFFVDLLVSPDPTIIVFAHKNANYVVDELKSVSNAWGPITNSTTTYLYWDVDLLTGFLTRGMTIAPPIYSGSPPSAPVTDQHWFDTVETTMRVWNGVKWLDKIRAFAGYVTSGSIIHPFPLGTQAGIIVECEGGNLVLDAYNKPLRQTDGTFVTTVTSLLIVNNSAKKVKFETEVLTGMAAEPIPKFSLVQVRSGRRLILARSNDFMTRISGVSLEDLYTNEVGSIVADGLIRNSSWSFLPNQVNRPVFCGTNGEVTTTPPTTGVIQVAGFVYDTDAIYMNVFPPIILDDLTSVISPNPLPDPSAPTADFYSSVTSGFAPLLINFSNASTNNPISFEWDFLNDGSVDASTASASYTYAVPGTYTVRLRAINNFGFDDEIKAGYITVLTPPPSVGYTNLDVTLNAVSQVLRGHTFPVSVTISNDGSLAATNVIRTIVIPRLKGEEITVSGLPPGTTVVTDIHKTTLTFAVVSILPIGLTYGPISFNVVAPNKSGSLKINASVSSPEIDVALGDNTTSISVEVRL